MTTQYEVDDIETTNSNDDLDITELDANAVTDWRDLSGHQSKWLRATAIRPHLDTRISSFSVETVKDRETFADVQKVTLTFEDTKEPLLANFSSLDAITQMTGSPDPHAWIGFRVRLIPEKYMIDGKQREMIALIAAPPAGEGDGRSN